MKLSFGDNELKAKLAALDRVQAIIEFDLNGTILSANQNFLAAVGYARDEIVGKHHSLFVEPAYRDSAEYKDFWTTLRAGQFQARQFRRFFPARAASEIWIEAASAMSAASGAAASNSRSSSSATDITAATKPRTHRSHGLNMIAAIRKAQAVIAFTLDGVILDANDNFLAAMGYARDEIIGKHHSIFVEPALLYEQQATRQFGASLERSAN